MIFIYAFKDGTVLRLVDAGLTLEEIWALEKLHGKCEARKTEGMR